ncbi:hypothetical protein COCNU_01G012610 [Cocos nucifera]|uniref:DUF4283 domain-containing protein n=1 Tax=Cocos nucifera TaxID=13894 RepID=A0A8K0MUY4_COCNU|nr:hypothetical protein COCNU_01G012610 [Cocos nucifera]
MIDSKPICEQGEVRALDLEQGHLLVRFEDAGERDLVLGWPWVVSGQALAVEQWRPRFRPGPDAIGSAVVWIRLPRLPVELGRRNLSGIS